MGDGKTSRGGGVCKLWARTSEHEFRYETSEYFYWKNEGYKHMCENMKYKYDIYEENIGYYESKETKGSIRYLWQVFIRNAILEYGPYRFFVTLSFQYTLSKRQAKGYAEQVAREVIKAITGKHGKQRNKKPPLEGVAILEMAKLFDMGSEGGHFHFLIKDHPALAALSDDDAIAVIDRAFNVAAGRLKLSNLYHRNRKVVESTVLVNRAHGIKTQLVGYNFGVADYLAKEARNNDWDIQERFFYLNLQDHNNGLSDSRPRF